MNIILLYYNRIISITIYTNLFLVFSVTISVFRVLVDMSIIENNIQDRTISFLDINFIINHQLFVERFQKKTTDTILYEHIKSKPPSGIGNYDLFFPYDHYPNKRKSQCIINPSMFVRIIEKGYSEYNYLEDYKKNLSKNRPPT